MKYQNKRLISFWIKSISLCLLVMSISGQAQCEFGTLRCANPHGSHQPVICNAKLGFSIGTDQNSCKKRFVPECDTLSHQMSVYFAPNGSFDKSDKCSKCHDGHYWNRFENKCSSLPTSTLRIQNCRVYTNDNSLAIACSSCNDGFYFQNGQCLDLKSESVSNCVMYDEAGRCLYCENGFQYEVSTNSCRERPEIQNCQVYAEVGCFDCKQGYHFVDRQTIDLSENMISEKYTSRSDILFNLNRELNFHVNQSKECKPISNPKCETIDPNKERNCLKCKPTYHLQVMIPDHESECLPIQDLVVENCKYYEDSIKCRECEENYFLMNQNDGCVKRQNHPISQCAQYDPQSDRCQSCSHDFFLEQNKQKCYPRIKDCDEGSLHIEHRPDAEILTCTRCANDYFYLENNECKPRDALYCQNFENNSTKCISCRQNYAFLGQNICFLKINSNCEEYYSNTHDCMRCKANYYRSHGKCKKAEMVGCSQFIQHSNLCETCHFNFYLDHGRCVSKSNRKCLRFNDNSSDCQECPVNYFIWNGECHLKSNPNCRQFKNQSNHCVACRDGYYLRDNVCVLTDIKNCIQTQGSSNNCELCQKGYYLTSNYRCELQDIEGCIDFSQNNLECTKCAVTHNLQNPQTCVIRPEYAFVTSDLPPDNCLIYEMSTKNCIKCAPGYFNEGSILRCQKAYIENCLQYKINQEFCIHCRQGFYPNSDGFCVAQTNIHRCTLYRTDRNRCRECEDRYYTEDGFNCKIKFVQNCLKYTESGGENICTQCNPFMMLYINSDGSKCLPIDPVPNCMKSDGVSNKCHECLHSTHTVINNTCQKSEEKIHNCLENSLIDDKSKCTKCKDYYHILEAFNHDHHEMTFFVLNCVQMSGTDKRCVQCKEFYRLHPDGTCEEEILKYEEDYQKEFCGVLLPNSIHSIYSNYECQSCPDQISFYITSENSEGPFFFKPNKCKKRDSQFLFKGCGTLDPHSDKCLSCSQGRTKLWTHPLICDRLHLPEIKNCLIRDGILDICFMCESNFQLKDSKCEEIQTPAKIPQTLDFEIRLTHTMFNEEKVVQNCKKYAQIHESDFGCVQCEGDYVGILSQFTAASSSSKYKFAYNNKILESLDNYQNHDIFNIFSKCENPDLGFRDEDKQIIQYAGKCEIGFAIPGKSGYGCLKCRDDMVGSLYEAHFDNENVALDSTVVTVASCFKHDVIGLQTNYFLSLRFYDLPNRVRLSSLISSMKCSLNNHELTHFFFLDPNSQDFKYTSRKQKNKVDPMPQTVCLDSELVNNRVEQCQMYFMSSDFSEDVDLLSQNFENLECLICKKDFRPTYDDSHKIIACENIVLKNVVVLIFSINIILSYNSSNLLLRSFDETFYVGSPILNQTSNVGDSPGAQTARILAAGESNSPPSTKKGPFSFDTNLPKFPKAENCVYYDLEQDICLVCYEHHWVNSGSCHKLRPGQFKNQTSNTNLKMMTNDLEKQMQFGLVRISKMSVRYMGSSSQSEYNPNLNIESKYSSHCSDDSKTMINRYEKIEVCEPEPSMPIGCLESSFESPAKCFKCARGYLPKADSTCKDMSYNVQCTKLDSVTSNCIECAETFFLNSEKICEKSAANPECVQFDSTNKKCLKCSEEYYLDQTDLICKYDTCLWRSDGNDNECVVCKDFHSAEKNPDGKYQCMNSINNTLCQNFSPSLGHCVKNKNHHYFSYIIKTMKDSITTIQLNGYFPVESILDSNFLNKADIYLYVEYIFNHDTKLTESYKLRILKTEAMKPVVYQQEVSHFCFPRLLNLNCEIYETLFCLKCFDYFYIDNYGHCKPTDINKCIDAKKEGDKVVCTKCKNDRFLNISDNNCDSYRTSSNLDLCKTLHSSQDKCLSCHSNLYLNESGLCSENSAPYCNEKSGTENKCRSCVFGYYLSGSNNCEPTQATNCESFKKTEDKCETCILGYKKDSAGNCSVINHSFNCLALYDNKYNKCESCSDLFLRDSENGACIRKTASHCQDFEQNENKCSSCPSGFILRNGECFRNSASNCESYKTSDDLCQDCFSSYFLQNNSCVHKNALYCKSLVVGQNKCDDCVDNYVKNDDGVCVFKEDVTCLRFDSTNRCSECAYGYHFHNSGTQQPDGGVLVNAGQCDKTEIEFCKLYLPNQNRCETCENGYFVNGEGTCNVSTQKNCNVHSTDNQDRCLLCDLGFWFDSNQQKCVSSNASNCLFYDQFENACLVCLPDYIRMTKSNGSHSCLSTDGNCLYFNTPLAQCDECKPAHYLANIGDEQICKPLTTVDKCEIYETKLDQCKICKTRFFYNQKSKKCEAVKYGLEGCKVYRDEFGCHTCHAKMFPNQDHVCQETDLEIPGCVRYDSATTCDQCEEGMISNSTKCVTKSIANCDKFSFVNEVQFCEQCQENFVPSSNKKSCSQSSEPKVEHCKLHGPNKTCNLCVEGYFSTPNKAQCLKLPTLENQYCKFEWYISESKCVVCSPGHWPDSNGDCKNIPIDYCLFANSDNSKCLICKENAFMNSQGECSLQQIKNCKSYADDNEYCTECKEGFFTYSNIDCDIINRAECEETHETLPQCKKCVPERFLNKDKICSEIYSKRCVVPNDTNEACQKCKDGFIKSAANQCDIPGKENCENEHQDEPKCLKCKAGYMLNASSLCQKFTLPNCQETNDNFSGCKVCVDGYKLYSDATCDIYNKDWCQEKNPALPQCINCINQKYLNRNKICTDMVPANCLIPDEYNEKCKHCVSNYQLYTDGACDIPLRENCEQASTTQPKCIKCKVNKYSDRMGICDDIKPKNCKTPDEFNEKCLTCTSDTFYLDFNGQCSEIYDPNCKTPKTGNVGCQECNVGYILDPDDHCRIKNHNFCARKDPNQAQCLECIPGKWIARDKICYDIVPANCQTPDEFNETCLTCKPGYLKYSGGVCDIPNRDFCQTVSPDQPKCLKCKTGKWPNRNNICENLAPLNCLTPDDFNEKCRVCLNDTYFLNSIQECIKNNVLNCLQPHDNNTDCKTCVSGFVLNTDNKCKITNEHLCKTKHPSQPICVECLPETFTNISTSLCEEIKAVNCKTADPENTKCEVCKDLYLLQIDGSCKIKNHDLCEKINPSQPKCDECKTNSYIFDKEEGACYRINIPNCQVPQPDNKKCKLCDTLFSLTSLGLCLPNNIKQCKVLDNSIFFCKECHEGYVLTNRTSCLIKNEDFCDIVNESKPECVKCKDDWFMTKDKICDEIFSKKCKVPDSVNEKCTECQTGYHLQDDGSCQITNFKFCEVEDQSGPFCVKCVDGKWIDRDRICDQVRPPNCLIPDEFNELCERCKEGKYRDKDKVCQTPELPGCIITDADADGKCVFCLKDVKLDLDSLSCV